MDNSRHFWNIYSHWLSQAPRFMMWCCPSRSTARDLSLMSTRPVFSAFFYNPGNWYGPRYGIQMNPTQWRVTLHSGWDVGKSGKSIYFRHVELAVVPEKGPHWQGSAPFNFFKIPSFEICNVHVPEFLYHVSFVFYCIWIWSFNSQSQSQTE